MVGCAKCTTGFVSKTYHRACASNSHEHLHYACMSCGYDWTGATHDQIQKRRADARNAEIQARLADAMLKAREGKS